MKVLVGRFSSESNEHSRSLMSLDKFILKYGEDCIDSMYCRDIFEENGIELIPSIDSKYWCHRTSPRTCNFRCL